MIQANLDNLQSNVSEAEKRLAEARLKGMEAAQERDRYAESFKEHAAVQNAVLILKPWLEKEKQLAVAEERKTTAMGRVLELSAELVDIDTEMAVKKREADRESEAAEGIQELKGLVLKMDSDIYAINDAIRKKQIEFGALKQKTEQIAQLKREIGQLQEQQAEYARETADFDILKAAFSQNGVPHQIILPKKFWSGCRWDTLWSDAGRWKDKGTNFQSRWVRGGKKWEWRTDFCKIFVG